MMLNVVAIMGRLVRDPELKQTNSGTSVCSFAVAVDAYSKCTEKKAFFFDCVAWRGTAEFVCKYFQKGNLIAIDGSLQQRSFEDKNGNKRTAIDILVQHVNFCGKESGGASSNTEPAHEHPQATDDFAPIEDSGDLPF